MYIADTKTWYLERLIRLLAGVFVAGSVVLGLHGEPGMVLFFRVRGRHAHDFCLDRFLPDEYYTLRFRGTRALQMLVFSGK